MDDNFVPSLAVEISESIESSGTRSGYTDFKSLVDIVLSVFGLLICIPLFLVVAVVIKMESPGPVFFRQIRRGYAGKQFYIWKFRTMYDGLSGQSAVTRTADCRMTRAGKFLRDSKLDELPQIINILNGDMSVIGPRPLSEDESIIIESLGYPSNFDGFHHRVKPGLIGLEQCKRVRSLSYCERFELNRIYSDNIGAGLDFYIFCVSLIQCRFVCSLAVICGVVEGLFLLH